MKCENIMNIQDHCLNNNFYFEDGALFNFHCSLQTKPFVILYGPSGTGKSKIAELYIDFICKNQNIKLKDHLCFIPVRPNWTSPSDLIGFYDYLNNEFIPTKFYEFLRKAESDTKHPYFVILDEMNLSIVEHYFSDFLACLESRRLTSSLNHDLSGWENQVTEEKYSTLSQASIFAFFDLVNKGQLNISETFTLDVLRNHQIVQEWKQNNFNGQDENWTPQFRTEFNQKDDNGANARLAGKFFEFVDKGVYRLCPERKYKLSELSKDLVDLIQYSSNIEQQEFDIYKNKSGTVSMQIPLNLYFIGTINIDESTHPLSSKVLDRANTIEMNDVSRKTLTKQFKQEGSLKTERINSNFSKINSLPNLNSAIRLKNKNEELITLLYDINDGLIPFRTNMGHRSIFEIAHYINLYTESAGPEYAEEALDIQLCQKLIPKLTGADERVEQSILHTVKVLTLNAENTGDMLLAMNYSEYKYPKSLSKLQKMYRYYRQNGFVNFANV